MLAILKGLGFSNMKPCQGEDLASVGFKLGEVVTKNDLLKFVCNVLQININCIIY